MRTIALALVLLAVTPQSGRSEDVMRPQTTHCGYLNAADCDMEKKKARNERPRGVQDIRQSATCGPVYTVRREGAACDAPGLTIGSTFPGGCCTLPSYSEDRETCRARVGDFVRDAQTVSRSSNRDRLWIEQKYNSVRRQCPAEFRQLARESGQELPRRSAAATPRANSMIAESLGRRPGSERRPDFVDSGGTDDTAEHVLAILEFALGAASIVAANYPVGRVGGSYGYTNPGRSAPSSGFRPAPRTLPSDITGTR